MVRTSPFHGGNMGSNPVGDASGGQRRQSSEAVMAEGEEPGRDAFEKMGFIPAFPRHFINAVL